MKEVYYTFSKSDRALIGQRRGQANRLGFAVQLCLLRYPGQGLAAEAAVPSGLLHWVARQLRLDPVCWARYAARNTTRREHLLELRAYLGLTPFGLAHFRQAVQGLAELAWQTDQGVVLAEHALDVLRAGQVILPALEFIEGSSQETENKAR